MNINSRYLLGLVLFWLAGMAALQALVEYGLLKPLANHLVQLEADVQTQRKLISEMGPSVPQTQIQMDAILWRLPGPSDVTRRLNRLHQLADSHSVLLRKASYQDFALPGPIVRKEISADLSGAYPSVRDYLRAVLVDDEAVAIEALEFHKVAGNSETEVRVQLRLALYSRGNLP